MKNIFSALKILTVLLFFACNKSNTTQAQVVENQKDTLEKQTLSVVENGKKDTVVIAAVGDIQLGTMVPSEAYLPPDKNCSPLMENVKKYLTDADVTFGNLEGTFATDLKYAKKCGDSKYCYTFGMPPEFVKCFKEAGFDILSVANNHSADFEQHGRKLTGEVLDKNGIYWAGLVNKPYAIFEKDGIKYGFTAFAPNQGTLQITDIKKAQNIVRHLDSICDIVIVSFHGGAEGKKYQHVPRKNEIFLGQNRGNVYEFAHKVIDAGADVVIGHGPHVTRAVEVYKNRFIAYSLGNFCTYSRVNITGVSGIAPILHIYLKPDGEFLKARIIPTYQIKNKGTFYDDQKRVIAVIKQLTAEDFPENTVKITDDGWIFPNK